MYRGQLQPVSNQATWTEAVDVLDEDTSEPVDISGFDEITIKVRDPRTHSHVLTATLTGGGITRPSTGRFQWQFSASQMAALCPGSYEVGVTFVDDDETTQLLIGTVPVLDGIVG